MISRSAREDRQYLDHDAEDAMPPFLRAAPRPRRRPLLRLARRLARQLSPPPGSAAARGAAALMRPFEPVSRILHDRLFDDVSQSLCSRGWWLRDRHPFWRGWVRFFGPAHCRAAFLYHHGGGTRPRPPPGRAAEAGTAARGAVPQAPRKV